MAASADQIGQVLRHARHPEPTKIALQIFERLHQPHLQADAVITRTKSRLMVALVGQLLPLLEQLAQYDKEIATLFLTHEDHEIFESLPRAGQRLAPRRLSEIGDDRTRDLDASSLQALGGTSPVLFQSGMYAKAHRRMGCIKPLRNALHQFAWQTTHSEPWANDYYQRKRAEGKSHSVAVRALANVWVRIIFAMWSQHCCYETAIFERAQHQHARRAA
jgi:transposase